MSIVTLTRLTIPPRTVLDVVRECLDLDGVRLVTVTGQHTVEITLDHTVITVAPRCVVCGGQGCEFCPKVGA